jgi:endonuclease/exonuclease/phosphatase family metal-dependent hydrolase
MKIKYLTFLIFIVAFQGFTQTKVCTFNIRFENPNDGVHQWENRKSAALNFIKIEQPDVIGMQEVLHSQIEFFNEFLPSYQKVGVARDDGKMKGEYSPLYYNKQVYELIDSGTFWLSPEPKIPAKAWDAALPRICSWAKLKNNESEEEILFLNTHFDHVGKEARKNSVDVILSKIKEMGADNKVILMGDFNLEPDTEPIQKIIDSNLQDSFNSELRLGTVGTYNAFQIGKNYDRRIDYIFQNGFEVINYTTYSLRVNDTFLSDHFPVLVELK